MSMARKPHASIARVVAMLMILATHYASYLGDNFFRKFLCGVSLFIIISGYLYADKEISGVREFLFGRFCKILIPAYIYCAIVFIYSSFAGNIPRIKDILIYLCNCGGIWNLCRKIEYFGFPGLEILWFLTAIGLCYVLLPALKWAEKKYSFKLLHHSILLACLFLLQAPAAQLGIQLSYLCCFYAGYFYGKYIDKVRSRITAIFVIFFITLFAEGCRLILRGRLDGSILYDYTIAPISEIFLALSVFAFVCFITKNVRLSPKGIVSTLDRYSMDVYIVHYTYYRGIFTAAGMTAHKSLDVLLMVLFTAIAVIPFHFICQYAEKGIRHIQKTLVMRD